MRMGERRMREKEMETWKRVKKEIMYCQRWVWRGIDKYLTEAKA